MRRTLPYLAALTYAWPALATPESGAASDEPVAAATRPTVFPAARPVVECARSDAPHAPEQSPGYGWQTPIADGASFALLVTGVSTQTYPLATLGAAGYFVAPPIVHFSHGNVYGGLASLT